MSVKANQETLGFQTEVKQLLDLMIHSLYSNREIFLRELISNASDAEDKLRFEALKDDSLYEKDTDLKIKIDFNKEQKIITILDNGIGMSREEIIENLGTIAKSGTKQFFDSLTGDQTKDSQLIGQFGVGFYSCFIVAKKVEVITRRAGENRANGVRWISEGENDYTIETVDRPKRGTKVILYLRDDADMFLDGFKLRSIITKYSDHISFPIVMDEEDDIDNKKEKSGEETVNSATALWARNKKEIKDEEYNEFYKHISHDYDDPIAHIHNKVEGRHEYTSLLYIPSRAPFDLWDKEQQHGVKLYVRRIFIMDDAKQILPSWLRFIRGVIDSNDLPLNVSREILQQNKIVDSIRLGCTKKIMSLLKAMTKKNEEYQKFWNIFGKVLKEGVVDNSDFKGDLSQLFRFSSTHEDTDEQKVSLKDYVGRMQEGQNSIYYVIADSYVTAKGSPHIEIFKKKGIEVLLLSEPIDEWVTTHLSEYEGKTLQSANKGELDLGDIQSETEKKKKKKNSEVHNDLIERIKNVVNDKVKDVRITERLTTSPACLVSDSNDMGRHLEQILKASGQNIPGSKPILEINPDHPIIKKISSEKDDDLFSDWSHILFDQALLSEGGQLADPVNFIKKLNSMIVSMSK
ncbi:MAG: molecular chaperone HtpG [Legionellales bacterium]|nr:molecular chaperone HtpG [Legionellales bacterium]